MNTTLVERIDLFIVGRIDTNTTYIQPYTGDSAKTDCKYCGYLKVNTIV